MSSDQTIPVYTFYSYKGGSCRSTTLMNTIKYLADALKADNKHPILIVDADVESAGITLLLKKENKFVSCINSAWCTTAQKLFSDSANSNDKLSEYFDAVYQPRNITYEYYLNQYTGAFAGTNRRLISTEIDKVCMAVKKRMAEADATSRFDRSIVEGMRLSERQWECFRQIVEMTLSAGGFLEDDCSIAMRTTFNLWTRCFASLGKTTNSANMLVTNFLPATEPVDVTKEFGLTEEHRKHCIRFVGAEIRRPVAAEIKNKDSNIVYDNILKYCENGGYRAVVFDSGAGTQTIPNTLHGSSDVIVYCLRPSRQFVEGTEMNIRNYAGILEEHAETLQRRSMLAGSKQHAKQLILLPTATPSNKKAKKEVLNANLIRLRNIEYDFIDKRFCSQHSALCEIEAFKLEEAVLSRQYAELFSEHEAEIFAPDADLEALSAQYSIPVDEIHASRVYRELAKAMHDNTITGATES